MSQRQIVAARRPQRLIRPLVRSLCAYVPGEQPKIRGLIKLNTNENPYPPAPKVLHAVRRAVDGRLRLYPPPTADPLRARLARFHRCRPENLIVGNGSDELLALATRAFVEPAGAAGVAKRRGLAVSKTVVQYFFPSYSLYPVLGAIHGARVNPVPLRADFSLPTVRELKRSAWDFRAALTFITTPNAPSGRSYPAAALEALCRTHQGVIVLDEAYVDFGPENAMELALKYPHVLVARTFSKGYSLCFLRVGYFVGAPELIGALLKIRDSYNVNGLGQLAAAATLEHLAYYRRNFRRIAATRRRVAAGLAQSGFEVFPSETNFLLVRPPAFPAKAWLEQLRRHKILVRWFDHPEMRHYLRVSIGTDAQMDRFLHVVHRLLRRRGRPRGR